MPEQDFTLTTPAFEPDGMIPSRFTCNGENKSPELNWMHPPQGTQSFALIVDDPDAPSGTFTHWVLFDIPGNTKQLSADVSGVGVGGRNDFQSNQYGGPCPPPNHGKHRYRFKLFALDIDSLGLDTGASLGQVEKAMTGHVLGQVNLVGQYERKTG